MSDQVIVKLSRTDLGRPTVALVSSEEMLRTLIDVVGEADPRMFAGPEFSTLHKDLCRALEALKVLKG